MHSVSRSTFEKLHVGSKLENCKDFDKYVGHLGQMVGNKFNFEAPFDMFYELFLSVLSVTKSVSMKCLLHTRTTTRHIVLLWNRRNSFR